MNSNSNNKMLIPSIIPSALHQPDGLIIKGTRGSDLDDVNSIRSYPAVSVNNHKMVDAAMQQDDTQSTHNYNRSPAASGINDHSQT